MTAPVRIAARAPVDPDMQTVTAVRHWTPGLFSFRTTRPRSLRFRSGEFVMIGLPGDNGRPLLRAYSIASPAWDDGLEFYSIKVPGGALTSRLQHLAPGDDVILRPKPVGTLVLDALLPGDRLWLFATGTGIAPFASLLRDPETYARFARVTLVHSVREAAELAYGQSVLDALFADAALAELIGGDPRGRLDYCPTVTRGPGPRGPRITRLIESGALFAELGVAGLDPAGDRAMICGSLGFNADLSALLSAAGLSEGANSAPGHFAVEKAFVERS